MLTAHCAVNTVHVSRRWGHHAASAKESLALSATMSHPTQSTRCLSLSMKYGQYHGGISLAIPPPGQQLKTGTICKLRIIFATHKKAIKLARFVLLKPVYLRLRTAVGRGGGIPLPRPAWRPQAVQRRFTHREILKGRYRHENEKRDRPRWQVETAQSIGWSAGNQHRQLCR